MEKQPQVVLLGKSVFMDSVATSLIERRFSDVIRINTDSSEFDRLLNSVQPDLIVYEHDLQNTNSLSSLLVQQSDTLLIAIDLNCSRALVLNSQLRPTRSMKELCELIKEEVQRCVQQKEVH